MTLRAAEHSAVIAAAGDALQDKLIKIYSESMPNILPTAVVGSKSGLCPAFDASCKQIRMLGGLLAHIVGTTCTAHSFLGSGLRGSCKSAIAGLGWAWERHLRQESDDTEAHEDFISCMAAPTPSPASSSSGNCSLEGRSLRGSSRLATSGTSASAGGDSAWC